MPVSSTSSRFSYDFNASQSPPDNRWAGPSESNVSKLYEAANQQTGTSNYSNGYMLQQQPSLDQSYLPFDGTGGDMNMALQPLPANAPSSGFSGPGLPFRGLDYIRNYNPGGYMVGQDQEGLWQTFDPGAFGFDPEIPFTLGDAETQDGQRWEGQS
ncbi:hypothetical protein NM688_g7583 [Phlebia brevispora]|uniref:Uncharacterized protein n=1 Tax=Phlebia brevispora TaxID=194682 RepID=A0ACC1S3P6_9APHY|nr:hypothetical protein NM688_g7583 [Phlebia brevispora]